MPSLIEAAERGKQAVCLVELKARFDERRNIGWARALEEAGAHVVHGLPGLKTHAKALLVVRREGGGLRHYVHIGTGNYHAQDGPPLRGLRPLHLRPGARRRRGRALQRAHRRGALAGLPQGDRGARPHARLVPRGGRKTIEARLAGQEARIVLKMNSLVDARCIRALYVASQAGRAGGRERARHLLPAPRRGGRVGQHPRGLRGRAASSSTRAIYGFVRGDERRYWIGSGDLMPRNLDTRVELLAPVEDPALRAEIEDTLERCLADDTFAWELEEDGSWTPAHRPHPLRAPRADGARPAPAAPAEPALT